MLTVVAGLAFGFERTDIQYAPPALIKELQKAGLSSVSDIVPLQLPPDLMATMGTEGKFFRLQDTSITAFRFIYVGRVNSCRVNGCSIKQEGEDTGSSEFFDYFILFDRSKTVRLVRVFNYQATHGQEITSKGWLRQFAGHDGSQALQVDKNIDAISGATISVYAITEDVAHKTQLLREL